MLNVAMDIIFLQISVSLFFIKFLPT
jgi:hypothetical protein